MTTAATYGATGGAISQPVSHSDYSNMMTWGKISDSSSLGIYSPVEVRQPVSYGGIITEEFDFTQTKNKTKENAMKTQKPVSAELRNYINKHLVINVVGLVASLTLLVVFIVLSYIAEAIIAGAITLWFLDMFATVLTDRLTTD